MSSIAFLFLTLGDINWNDFWEDYVQDKRINIYVHPKHPELVTIPWMKKNIVPRLVDTGWGFIVEAYVSLLETAMKNKDNIKFISISESCIPIKSFNELYETLMSDDPRTSYVKSMRIGKYDWEERIKTQPNYRAQKFKFRKHYARFCLSRYHVQILLQKKEQLKFFYKMHVGDEFFLSLIYPYDHIKDFAITFDNWDAVKHEIDKINVKIEKLYVKLETNEHTMTDDAINKINNEINVLREKKHTISANPKSYVKVYKKDIKEAFTSEHFFWRKFPINSEIIKYKDVILNKIKL